jgi:hypothetical protein
VGSKKVYLFQGGSPEQYCRWRRTMQEVFASRDCDDLADLEHIEQQVKLFKATLTGRSQDTFTSTPSNRRRMKMLREKLQERHSRALRCRCSRPSMSWLAMHCFTDGEEAPGLQKQYMLNKLPSIEMPPVQEWCDCLLQINLWLPYFPVKTDSILAWDPSPVPKQLDDQQLLEAMDQAVAAIWKAQLKAQHVTSFNSFQAMKARRYKDIQSAMNVLLREELNQEDQDDQPPESKPGSNHKNKNQCSHKGTHKGC